MKAHVAAQAAAIFDIVQVPVPVQIAVHGPEERKVIDPVPVVHLFAQLGVSWYQGRVARSLG